MKLFSNGRFFGLRPFLYHRKSVIFLFHVSIVDFRPLFELLSKIVRGQSPLTLKNQNAIPEDEHMDSTDIYFSSLRTGIMQISANNPSCEVFDHW